MAYYKFTDAAYKGTNIQVFNYGESYRDFTYTWKLYQTEWTNEIQPGTYQIIVGGNYEPHSANGKVSTLIDIF